MTEPIIKRVVEGIEGEAAGAVRASVVISTPRHFHGMPPGIKGADLDRVRMAMKTKSVKTSKLVISGFEFEPHTGALDAAKMFLRDAHLREVSLAHTKLGDDQAVAILAAASKQGCQLESLDLMNTGIGGVCAAKAARLLEPVHVNLRVLNVSFNPITAEGVGLLLKWACGLAEIDASYCGVLTQASITSRRSAMEFLEEGLRENISCRHLRLVGNGFQDVETTILLNVVAHNARSSLRAPSPGVVFEDDGGVNFTTPAAQEKVDVLLEHMVYVNAQETERLYDMHINTSGGFEFESMRLDEGFTPEEGAPASPKTVRMGIETIQSQRKLELGGDAGEANLGLEGARAASVRFAKTPSGSPGPVDGGMRKAKSARTIKRQSSQRRGGSQGRATAGGSPSPRRDGDIEPRGSPRRTLSSTGGGGGGGSMRRTQPQGAGGDASPHASPSSRRKSSGSVEQIPAAELIVQRAASFGGVRLRRKASHGGVRRSKSMRVKGSENMASPASSRQSSPRGRREPASPTSPGKRRGSYHSSTPTPLDTIEVTEVRSARSDSDDDAPSEDARCVVLAGKDKGKSPPDLAKAPSPRAVKKLQLEEEDRVPLGRRARSAPARRRGTIPQSPTSPKKRGFERSTYSSKQKHHAVEEPETAKYVEDWHHSLAHAAAGAGGTPASRQLSSSKRSEPLDHTPPELDLAESKLPRFMTSTTASRHRHTREEPEEVTDILELRSRSTPSVPPDTSYYTTATSSKSQPPPLPTHVVQTTASWRGKYEAKPSGQGWVPVKEDEESSRWKTTPQMWPDRTTRDQGGAGARPWQPSLPNGSGSSTPRGGAAVHRSASTGRHSVRSAAASGVKDRQTPAILNACIAGNAICQQLLGAETSYELPHGYGGAQGVPLAFIAHSALPDALNELPLGSVERVGGIVKLLYFITQTPFTKVETSKGTHNIRYLPGIPSHLETEDEVIEYVGMLADKHRSRRYEMLAGQPRFTEVRAEENRTARTLLRQHRKLEACVGRGRQAAKQGTGNRFGRSVSVGATPVGGMSPGRAGRRSPSASSLHGRQASASAVSNNNLNVSGATTNTSTNIATRRPWGQDVKANPQKRPWGGSDPAPVDVRQHVHDYMRRPERLMYRMQAAHPQQHAADGSPVPGQRHWPVPLSQAAAHYGRSASQSARSYSSRAQSVSPPPAASAQMNGVVGGDSERFRVHTTSSRRKTSDKTLPISSMHWYRRSKSYHG